VDMSLVYPFLPHQSSSFGSLPFSEDKKKHLSETVRELERRGHS
jgi:hypothetical protein